MDVHTRNAAALFECLEGEVTQEKRNLAKVWRHAENYSTGAIKMGLVIGQYPIKVEPE